MSDAYVDGVPLALGTVPGMPSLGTCCICETEADVTIVAMLGRRCVVAGHGWGCVVCGLPCDGAVAVVCGVCVSALETVGYAALRFACRGHPATDGRIAIGELPPGEFGHDEAAHGG